MTKAEEILRMTTRVACANQVSDEIVEVMNRGTEAGTAADAILLGLLLALLSWDASIPHKKPPAVRAAVDAAAVCINAMGGTAVPETQRADEVRP